MPGPAEIMPKVITDQFSLERVVQDCVAQFRYANIDLLLHHLSGDLAPVRHMKRDVELGIFRRQPCNGDVTRHHSRVRPKRHVDVADLQAGQELCVVEGSAHRFPPSEIAHAGGKTAHS